MNVKTPINENYAGTVVKITSHILLDNCTNVVHTNIFGNLVVISKDTKEGEIGIFFPAETKLSEEYLHENNLYRNNTLNKDINVKGYFEENGRIRCVRFRTHKSEGIFMPKSSLLFAAEAKDLAKLDIGATFDHINGIKICEKYVPKIINTPGLPGSKGKVHAKKVSRLVENQFRFHGDTGMLGKNIWRIQPETLIQITNKLHGTSFVVSKILTKVKLNWFLKLLKRLKIPIIDKIYGVIYSSRKVIKNDDMNKNYDHYYGEDVWAEIAAKLTPFLLNGMTVYGEAVGFTKSGKAIQGKYDYGCMSPNYEDESEEPYMKIFIYRITVTNDEGKVFEFSGKQVQDWCKANGLLAVPEYYYGQGWLAVKNFIDKTNIERWQGEFLSQLLQSYNMEQDCELCKNKVPAEGIVLRIEGLEYDAYKLKSFRFREAETKALDAGEIDLESQQSQEE